MKKSIGCCPSCREFVKDRLFNFDRYIKSKVAQECLKRRDVNDVWGGQRDPEMLSVIADYDAACILMHNADGTLASRESRTPGIEAFLQASIDAALRGVHESGIILDPGLGLRNFRYSDYNARAWAIKAFRLADSLGASRKSMIAQLLDIEDPKELMARWQPQHGRRCTLLTLFGFMMC